MDERGAERQTEKKRTTPSSTKSKTLSSFNGEIKGGSYVTVFTSTDQRSKNGGQVKRFVLVPLVVQASTLHTKKKKKRGKKKPSPVSLFNPSGQLIKDVEINQTHWSCISVGESKGREEGGGGGKGRSTLTH